MYLRTWEAAKAAYDEWVKNFHALTPDKAAKFEELEIADQDKWMAIIRKAEDAYHRPERGPFPLPETP